jgi:hypothetical protein
MDNLKSAVIPDQDQSLLDRIYDLRKMREPFEPDMYMARKAYDGEHFMVWSKELQKLAPIHKNSKTFNQLPEMSKQIDSFQNFLLSTNFTFTVAPTLLSDDNALNDSVYLSVLAQESYKKLKESTIFQDFIHYALLDNTSYIEVTPDDKKKDVKYKVWDGFDILYDLRVRDWNEQKFIVKVVRKNKKDLKKSKLYSVGGNNLASGTMFFSYKDIYEKEKYLSFTGLEKDEVLLFECYIMEEDGLRIKTIDGSATVIRNDKYESVSKMPIIPLRIFAGAWLQKSFANRLIPLNRNIDIVNDRISSMILRLAKGGWLMQDEEKVDAQMNEEIGQIVRYESTKPEAIDMPQVPAFLPNWFNGLLGLAERYGISSIISGGMPVKASGIRATGMLDKMTSQATKDNTSVIDNLQSAIKNILELTFMFYYEMWKTPVDAIYTDIGQKVPRFISAKYKSEDDKDLVGVPNKFKKFSVEIDDALGYTVENRKNMAVELNKMGLISGEVLKKVFKLGSSAYLLEPEGKPMYESKEFQTLLDNFATLDATQKQSVINTMQIISEQQKDNKAAQIPGQKSPSQEIMAQALGQTQGGQNASTLTE